MGEKASVLFCSFLLKMQLILKLRVSSKILALLLVPFSSQSLATAGASWHSQTKVRGKS